MSKERELLRQSLIALEDAHLHCQKFQDEDARLSVINQIKELLAQPEQDSIQYLLDQVARLTAENAMLKEKWSTPKREPLSDAQIAELWGDKHSGKTYMVKNFARAIEKAHGIGDGE